MKSNNFNKFYLVLILGLLSNTAIFANKKADEGGLGTGLVLGAASVPAGKLAWQQYMLSTNPGKIIVQRAHKAAAKKALESNKKIKESGQDLSDNFDQELDSQIKSFFQTRFGTSLSEKELASFKDYAGISSSSDLAPSDVAANITRALGNIKGTAKSVDISTQDLLSRMRQVRGFNKGFNQDDVSGKGDSSFEDSLNTASNLSRVQTGVNYDGEGVFSTNLGTYARNLSQTLDNTSRVGSTSTQLSASAAQTSSNDANSVSNDGKSNSNTADDDDDIS